MHLFQGINQYHLLKLDNRAIDLDAALYRKYMWIGDGAVYFNWILASNLSIRIESNKFNMKETWKTLNNLLGRNNQTKLPDFFKDNNGNKIQSI